MPAQDVDHAARASRNSQLFLSLSNKGLKLPTDDTKRAKAKTPRERLTEEDDGDDDRDFFSYECSTRSQVHENAEEAAGEGDVVRRSNAAKNLSRGAHSTLSASKEREKEAKREKTAEVTD